MRFLKGKEAAGGLHYSDYVVFCGRPIEKALPEYKDMMDAYRKWIGEHDAFEKDYLYPSACHVMALDLAGHARRARDIFSNLKPFIFTRENTLNPFVSCCHLGWYLYGSIVTGEKELQDRIFAYLTKSIDGPADRDHYFTAYCLFKAYERTKEDRYKKMFLTIAVSLKPFTKDYLKQATTDGHMGMTLQVFATAFRLTQDKEYREIARQLAVILLSTQASDGSWNNLTAYTIMPAEGLMAYRDIQ